MTDENSRPNQTYPRAISTPVQSGVWAWLFWLRYWLVGCYSGQSARRYASLPAGGQELNRARRKSNAYFEHRAVPPARNLAALRALGPRWLTPTQSQERLARISVLGRVRIYGISWVGSVLLRRALLVCYDHGWWRAPMLRLRGGLNPKFLRPP